ncbi:MAG: hypothetical protein KGH78_02145 [Candidatus Micrarchaeota archaeon]|nr:hypothetical protein [Candidatus Micrarchaeota archaeon]MDE1847037.1 hypothetical protein [Candidatus Micrarchaeota archaeon]
MGGKLTLVQVAFGDDDSVSKKVGRILADDNSYTAISDLAKAARVTEDAIVGAIFRLRDDFHVIEEHMGIAKVKEGQRVIENSVRVRAEYIDDVRELFRGK